MTKTKLKNRGLGRDELEWFEDTFGKYVTVIVFVQKLLTKTNQKIIRDRYRGYSFLWADRFLTRYLKGNLYEKYCAKFDKLGHLDFNYTCDCKTYIKAVRYGIRLLKQQESE